MPLPNLQRLVKRCAPLVMPMAEAAQLVRSKQAVLVDIGEPAEWLGGVAKAAVRLPFSDFTGARKLWGPFLAQSKDQRLAVYGRSCQETAIAVKALQASGLHAVDAGTLQEWHSAGWAVCKPRPDQLEAENNS